MMIKHRIQRFALLTGLGCLLLTSCALSYGINEHTAGSVMMRNLLESSRAQMHKTVRQAPKQKENNPKQTVTVNTAYPTTNHSNQDTLDQYAFNNMAHRLMPLSPEQIRALHYLFARSQRAAAAYPGVPPKPTSTSVIVNLSPGSTPPVIRLRAGFVTSLVFLDSTGAPWPIVAYDLGDPTDFNVEPTTPDGKSDMVLVQALSPYKSGNIAVMLKGENTPIMLTLMPGQSAVDYRVDLRIPGFGPNAHPMVDGLPNTSNPQLLNFLDGVPPAGAKALQLEGGYGQAWLYGHRLYYRTQRTLLSPSWLATMSSPDGTHVYELVKTPVLLTSEQGRMMKVLVKGLS